MPRERHAVAAVAAAAVVLVSPALAGAEVRGLFAADGYLATTRHATTAAADVAWSAHLEWREPEQTAVLDWVSRDSLLGGPPRRELHELSYVERRIPNLELTVGRFRVPGGFWLISDGAGVALRTDTLVAGVFGGSRSFTNGRAETLLTSSPRPLPLVGASVRTRGELQATASYVYTADRVTLYRGEGMSSSSRQPEQFVDGELATAIGERGFFTAGVTIGSRYLVSYPTAIAQVTADPRLENVWFGSQSAYALLDWRLGPWRLDAIASALRTKLGQVSDPVLASISGSFVDGTTRARWRDRSWQLDGRYRLRWWADRSRAQRAELSARWQHGAIALAARVGLDLHHNATEVPGLVSSRTLLYRASVGHRTARSELSAGVAAVAALGDELAAEPNDPSGDARDQRAPYTLDARSYGFVRLFATRGAWFAGLDGEANLRGDGMRALLQLGCSR